MVVFPSGFVGYGLGACTVSEEPLDQKQKPEEIRRGFDDEGFFNLRIHASRGPEVIIGWLMMSIDLIKMFYVEQQRKKQEASVVKPNNIIERFKNKWH